MSVEVNFPIRTYEQAEQARAAIAHWPPSEERDDRLIEIAVLILETLWDRHRPRRHGGAFDAVRLILESKRVLVHKFSVDRPSRKRQAADLENDEITTWQKEPFYAMATCERIFGSLANADLFRHALRKRFVSDSSNTFLYTKLGLGADHLLELHMTVGHKARREAAELDATTFQASIQARRRRI